MLVECAFANDHGEPVRLYLRFDGKVEWIEQPATMVFLVYDFAVVSKSLLKGT